MPELSIVIPTVARSGTLTQVLEGLQQQVPGTPDFAVVVVEDADAAVQVRSVGNRESCLPPVRVLKAQAPGASAARNVGWRASKTALVLFLDDDVRPTPTLVAEHIRWHRRYPEAEIGVLGDVRWAPELHVTPFMRWLEMGIQFDYRSIEDIDARPTRFYTCNASVKRLILERAGGFDEQEFPYGYEDLDLAYRMADLGFRLLYNRAAVGDHLKTETIESWRRNIARIALAERRFVRRYAQERPHFFELFASAARSAPARGRAARLARVVRPEIPWLGSFVWNSYDAVCRQQLAPQFLTAWEEAGQRVSEPD